MLQEKLENLKAVEATV